MSIYGEWANLHLVEILRIWGKFDIPVFEYDGYNTLDSYNQATNYGLNDFTINLNDNSFQDQVDFFINTWYGEVLGKCAALQPLPYEDNIPVETFSYEYTPGYTVTIGYYHPSEGILRPESLYSMFNFGDGIQGAPYMGPRCMNYKENGYYRAEYGIYAFNGCAGFYMRLKDGNNYLYCRASCWQFSINPNPDFSNARYVTIWGYKYSSSRRAEKFFGDFRNGPKSLTDFENNPVSMDPQNPVAPPNPDDPDGNVPTDTQNPGGYDPDSDDIPFGVQNWLNASALGLCTVYNPTVAQVQALATRLYSKDFWSGFENYLWGNPVESILGLSVVPCAVPDGGQGTVKSWGLDTGVTMTLAGSTLVHVDCGQLPVPKLYETYLDWSPYTIAEIYIPYVGFVGLDVDDIMGQNLQLHYYIDIISCSAICQLVISNTSTTTVLGQWSCQVGRQIPVGSKDYNDIINAGIQLVATTIGAVGGNVIPEIVTDLGDALQYEGGGFNGARFATQMLRAGSSAIMQAKPNITRGAAIANASGQLAVQYPYLILKRPVAAQSNGYGALVGFPTFKYGSIGSYTGYVRCHNIKLDGIAATDWELSEIFRLCCEGVYI